MGSVGYVTLFPFSFIVLSCDLYYVRNSNFIVLDERILPYFVHNIFILKKKNYFINREGAKAVYGQPFGRGTGPVYMIGVECQGNESSILQCNHRGWENQDCDHSRDVSVNCTSFRSMFDIYFTIYICNVNKHVAQAWRGDAHHFFWQHNTVSNLRIEN